MPGRLRSLLRGWRNDRKLSLRALSTRSGVARSTLGGWETGISQPCIPELSRVLDALEVLPGQRQAALSLVDAPRGIRELRGSLPQGTGSEPAIRVPVAGDLLRTMRRRRDLSLDQVAGELGVQPSTVSRWETGESAPPAGRLQALLDLLDALPGERAALAVRRRLLSPIPNGHAVSLEDLAGELDLLTLRVERGERALMDLEFLAWETRLWPLLSGSAAARELLAEACSQYAEWLCREGRLPEASDHAGRALSLAGDEAAGSRRYAEILERCVRVSARVARRSGRRDAPLRVLAWLRKWLPASADPRLEIAIFRKVAEVAGLSVPPLQPSLRPDG